jgi:hypothetical protein
MLLKMDSSDAYPSFAKPLMNPMIYRGSRKIHQTWRINYIQASSEQRYLNAPAFLAGELTPR